MGGERKVQRGHQNIMHYLLPLVLTAVAAAPRSISCSAHQSSRLNRRNERQTIEKGHVRREGIATSATESVMPLAAAKNRGVRP